MHSLSVSTIAAEQLMQALDSIAYQVREQRAVFERAGDVTSLVEEVLREEQKKSRDQRRSEERIRDGVDDLDERDDNNGSDDDSASAKRARRPSIRKPSATTS
ncbi:MAG: hypothetical protein ACKOAT_09160, partial [Actinomycetota bacterium]